jgi:virginiamycin B lyase
MWLGAGLLCTVLTVPAVTLVSGANAGPVVTLYSNGISAGAAPNGIAKGPDSGMWFTEYNGDKIGHIAPGTPVTEYPTSGPGLIPGAAPAGIVTGPDGNIYFTEFEPGGNGAIGELDPTTGALIGQYPTPTSGAEPDGIAVGADGAIWFTEQGADRIGRLDPVSHAVTEYRLHVGTHLNSEPTDLVTGPDGALWVTLLSTGQVARLAPGIASPGTDDGLTFYGLPSATTAAPECITVGPDNNLWVAEYGAGKVARIDTALVQPGTSAGITEFATGGKPLWISVGGDGALWLTDNTDKELLRFDITTGNFGTVTVFGAAQGVDGDVTTDAEDQDGNLWFTEFKSDEVGEVTLAAAAQGSGAPQNTKLPTIAGPVDNGQTVSCLPGAWTNDPTTYSYQWTLDGQDVSGANDQTFKISGTASPAELSCVVTASNAVGHATAASSPVSVGVAPPPQLVAQPVIRGATYDAARGEYLVSAGQSLSCDLGKWAYATPFRDVWWADVAVAAVGPFGSGTGVTGVQRVAFAVGPSTVTVPDYPVSTVISGRKIKAHTVLTDIQCQVDAIGLDGSLQHAIASVAGSAATYVYIKQLAPVLDFPRSRKLQCQTSCGPVVSPAVGYGQVNVCTTGRWLHYPTSFSFEWLARKVATVAYGPAVVVGRKQDLRMGYAEERQYVYCRVTASNGTGHASAFSNGYVVPRLGLVALGVARIKEEQPGPARFVPATSPVDPLLPDASEQWQFSCYAPTFNKAATVDYYWAAQWAGGPDGVSGQLGDPDEGPPPLGGSEIPPVSGVILDIDAAHGPVDTVLMTTVGGASSVRDQAFKAVGGFDVAVIGCYVWATAPDGQQAYAGSDFTWIQMPYGTTPSPGNGPALAVRT